MQKTKEILFLFQLTTKINLLMSCEYYYMSELCMKKQNSFFFLHRSAVYAVIAVSRLQFITKRWHTGVRNTYHRHPRPQVPNNVTVTRPLVNYNQYRPMNVVNVVENVPVFNNQNLSNVSSTLCSSSAFTVTRPITPVNEDVLPWSGSTPPSRDMGLTSPIRNRSVSLSQVFFLILFREYLFEKVVAAQSDHFLH